MISIVRFSLLVFLLPFAIAGAAILRVPTVYSTIRSAVAASANGDTILLAPGTYTDTVTLRANVTIASNYLLTGDTASIFQTNWQTIRNATNYYNFISINTHSLTLSGIQFVSLGNEINPSQVIGGTASNYVNLDHCMFTGPFYVQGTPVGLINLVDSTNTHFPDFTMTYCRYIATDSSHMPWVAASAAFNKVTITDCYASGQVPSMDFLMGFAARDTVIMRRCIIRSRRCGIHTSSSFTLIDSCQFIGNSWQSAVVNANNALTPPIISNCLFDSIQTYYQPGFYALNPIEFFSNPGSMNILRNCTIRDCFGDTFQNDRGPTISNSLILMEWSSVRVINCNIYNNLLRGSLVYFSTNSGDSLSHLDSCQIHDNRFAFVVSGGRGVNHAHTNRFNLSYCDFDRDSMAYFDTSVTSVSAPNCWWGDSSGPNYTGNPNGRGLTLRPLLGVVNVNPVPWRTVPVFPTLGVNDPIRNSLPNRLELNQNYPNPFNSKTEISYTLPVAGRVNLTVFDITGRQVATLVDGYRNQSRNIVPFDASSLSTGIYFYRLQANGVNESRKMILLK